MELAKPILSHSFSNLTIECEINEVSYIFNMYLDKIILPQCI